MPRPRVLRPRTAPGQRVAVGAEEEARFDGLDVDGFAGPGTGPTFGVLLVRVNADRRADAWAAFVAHAHAGPARRTGLVVRVGNTGWHVAQRWAVPEKVG